MSAEDRPLIGSDIGLLVGRPRKTSKAEPGVRHDPVNTCPAQSPGGWRCCLPKGHDKNHIGTTGNYELLYQWEQADKERPAATGRSWHAASSKNMDG